MNKTLLSTVAMAAMLLIVACGKDEDNPAPPAPQSKVMFVNAFMSVDSLRAQINDTTVVGANALAYLNKTGYITTTPGSKKLGFRLTSSGASFLDTTLTLSADNAYSVYTSGDITGYSLIVTQDDLSLPTTGNAKVRFINLSPDTTGFNAYVGIGDTATLGTNVGFKEATAFKQFAQGSYNILLQNFKQLPDVETIGGFQLTAGKVYTILLTGRQSSTGTFERKATVITNE